MRNLQRNLQTIYYRLYSTATEQTYDEYGNETLEPIVSYSAPVEMKANVSPATGTSQTYQFGNLDNYDRVVVTADMSCPIDENSVLYIGIVPTATVTTENGVTTTTYSPHNYVVRRVSRSINSVSIAVGKVDVS